MYIESVYIERFGGLAGFSLDFSAGVNIIQGKNESGKTTVGAFIKFIFYGFKDKRERGLYMCWNSDAVSGRMTFVYNGERYRIERECTAGGSENVRIIETASNAAVFKDRSPAEVFFNVPADVFERTVYVRQADNGRIDGRGIGEAIENLLFSADETVNTNKAVKKLDEARTLLLHKNGKGGKIFELENKLDSLKIEFQRSVEINRDIIIKEGEFNETRQKILSNEENNVLISEKIISYEKLTLLKQYKNLAELRSRIDGLEKNIAALKAEYAGNTNFLPDKAYIDYIKELDYEIKGYEEKLNEIERENQMLNLMTPDQTEFLETIKRYGGYEALINKLDSRLMSRRMFMIGGAVFGILCAVAVFFGIFIMLINNFAGLAVLALAAVFLLGAVLCFLNGSRQTLLCKLIYEDFGVANDEELEKCIEFKLHETVGNRSKQETAEMIRKDREALIGKKKEKRDELDLLLKMWNKPNAKEVISDGEKFIDLLRDQQYELDKCNISYNNIKTQVENSDYTEAELRERFIDIDVDTLDIKNLRREYEYIFKQNETLKNKAHDIEKQLVKLRAEAVPPSLVSEQINELSERISNLRKCHDAYLFAHDKLEEASISLRSSVAPKLSEYSSRLIDLFSEGKYKSLGIGTDFIMEYEAGEMTRSCEFMSAGTLDIAYFSLRFALSNLLYHGNDPPMIFDESFARLDDERFKNVLRLIKTMAGTGAQFLIFTSQNRDAALMSEVGMSETGQYKSVSI